MNSDKSSNEVHQQSNVGDYIPLSTMHVALPAAVVNRVLWKLICGLDKPSHGDGN
ncbi:hypothetical protein [Duganella qianjiadongensis]|uniref:Uncharacterized protein n=1 Tax=Duganella qianjiadongensis TaxID=2692176 RepID=A0ABW9VSL6_9BURK|nr:hypothetical protein [Duganella qianjiadongensis]MYM41934.1 hypothetical protein [Duganella qianjiadongensis]